MGESRPMPDVASLVETHHARLYRYACRLASSTADAEDLTQQTFLVAQTKLDQLRDPKAAGSWLMAILRNCYLGQQHQRRAKSETSLDLSLDWFPEETDETDDIDREALQATLDEMPEDFRHVLLLFYFEELSYREIAEQLGLPLGTVMSRLSRAKSQLRKRLLRRRVPVFGPKRQGLTTDRV